MALENWVDKQDGIDDILAEDINSIANAVIETQREINQIVIDQTYTPESENAQSGTAVAEAVATEQNRADNTFANALKGSKSGSAILIDDISPVEHTMTVKVSSDTVTDLTAVKVSRCGKNLFDGERRSLVLDNKNFADYDAAGKDNKAYQSIKIYLPAGTYSLNANIPISIIRRIIDNKWSQLASMNINHEKFTTTQAGYIGFTFKKYVPSVDYPAWNDTDKIWITAGAKPTEYEPYIEPTIYTPSADGTIKNVKSLYPATTLLTDTAGAVIEVEYNRDINKAFAALEAAIATNNS